MRGQFTRTLLLGILLCMSFGAHAAFITDKIVVEVRSEPLGQGAVLKKLPSGTAVDVLMSNGQYTRIRTTDNITGWVASTFLTDEKPAQLEYLDLLGKNKALEADLKAAQEKLAAPQATTATTSTATSATEPTISPEELADLQQRAKDVAWMRVELKKARDRADAAEAKIDAKAKTATVSQQELDKLRTDNKALEERLAAAMLVSQQQPAELTAENETDPAGESTGEDAPSVANNDNAASVNIPWFLGSSVFTLIAGFVAGILWLDTRIRRRHGGFRIY